MNFTPMDREEEIVQKYLSHQGFQNIQYEPDGKIPPDFSIDGKIGVEVRRLNQHYLERGKPKPLEELAYKLVPRIDSLLTSYGNVSYDRSAYIFLDFERPLKVAKPLMEDIKKELDAHLPNIHLPKKVKIRNGLAIRFVPAIQRYESAYILGSSADYNSGGFVVGNIYDNLSIVIPEKEEKVKPYFYRYDTWWLVLANYLGYGLSGRELAQLNALAPIPSIFEKVILLSPLDFRVGYEIQWQEDKL